METIVKQYGRIAIGILVAIAMIGMLVWARVYVSQKAAIEESNLVPNRKETDFLKNEIGISDLQIRCKENVSIGQEMDATKMFEAFDGMGNIYPVKVIRVLGDDGENVLHRDGKINVSSAGIYSFWVQSPASKDKNMVFRVYINDGEIGETL